MPELPEVETVRRDLNRLTLDQEIQGGDVLLTRTIAHPVFIGEFLAGLQGKAIVQWHRRGKYLLAELRAGQQAGGWLGVHLRMTGQLLWCAPDTPLQKHTRVRLFFASPLLANVESADHSSQRELRFVDQRTFGQLWWVPPDRTLETIITGLQNLGPEPFSTDFSDDYLAYKVQHRRRPIKSALLDQALVAGVGNIYADEALFLSQIHPQTLCADLTRLQIERLRSALLQVLESSIAVGGTTFSTFLSVRGINGNYGGVAQVYNRKGEPCRVCGTLLQRLKLAGRSAHFCPQCQVFPVASDLS